MNRPSNDRRAPLAELERRMRDLLGALDGAQANVQSSTDALAQAWHACAEHSDEIEALARAPREVRATRRADLERLVQLNAVARSAAEAERDRVRADLTAVTSAQARLGDLRGADEHGESCDVAG